jgi:biopolymer transport protein ExbD|tara:strand:- start:3818 stop:4447 length:630 start_codon:yes stop_codon:yes gene_type:complete
MARRDTPEINAGSMADIAFLLLIFFLVTTTMDIDAGISRRLPEKQPDTVEPPVIKKRNIFEISINRNDDLLIEDEYRTVDEVKQLAIDFIDNGGGLGNIIELFGETEGTECTWCQGKKDESSSDHPNKAIISIKTDRSTTYGIYIKVQNEVSAALTFLRNRLAKKEYGKTYTEMVKEDKNNKINPDQSLKDKIKKIKVMYPEIITEQNN